MIQLFTATPESIQDIQLFKGRGSVAHRLQCIAINETAFVTLPFIRLPIPDIDNDY